jgi:hypothetical protein
MDISLHGNVMPWAIIDFAYLLQWLELSLQAVTLLTLGGCVYAGVHFLLSNRSEVSISFLKWLRLPRWVVGGLWSVFSMTTTHKGKYDEA